MSPTSRDFLAELRNIFAQETAQGKTWVTVEAGALHRRVGSYPGPGHRMPSCCQTMKAQMADGDEIISMPPRGQGASLTIRYRMPRERAV